jgi:hypothetical protein
VRFFFLGAVFFFAGRKRILTKVLFLHIKLLHYIPGRDLRQENYGGKPPFLLEFQGKDSWKIQQIPP